MLYFSIMGKKGKRHKRGHTSKKNKLGTSKSISRHNVSVNSNWVHLPPGKSLENILSERIPATQEIFCLIPLCRGKNDLVEFPGVVQNFPKLEETAPKACKKSLRKLRDNTNFLFGELNKTFIF